ncbi:tRNA nucleotidyltransferase [Candidatus Blochmanniella floridana]|uniref:CCA-adding enzyme n=1 Tax=Blochmanniella floridana TaxID=203907 RepID=CCA_BLOFL|nr:RecName: Full=CCA-adding enzyme; AltName: Full=CCA tRNA nucleotidyltransferase; AltName: Full=tRNA CCA-pyrophosphorylase; AltName: Full=tRNA adenylyl-/cytidylyl- transferase; AltName: Full=tRNA nucleotidyltransferase; AltName: Full=tRNA-NT [Candidatus Blochmannia floridanus]CAD83587.1 tRNA nucleotidyltransferase [Candidatus Blochmannia floridanus]
MKKYLVGGAVRDSLLNLPITEKDWVITGSSAQEMLSIGYEQVGKDFPVFLHPKSHEEYALARTERKLGSGYTGFICHTEPSITIEEDLYRRDLTINAMAYDMNGNLLDPYNGQKDIQLRLLRHVSNAFYEDPLRVLRVARFAAKLKNIGFTIAIETFEIMTHMIHELKSLSPERVWMETKKALITDNPQVYFQVLKKCGALKILFPELDILFTIPQCTTHHSNLMNLGNQTMTRLSNISCLSNDLAIRYAILCCNLGSEMNPRKQPLKQLTQKKPQISIINNLCNRLKVPNNILKLTKIVFMYYHDLYDVTKLSSEMIMTIFQAFDCWRTPTRIELIIKINQSQLLGSKFHINYLFFQSTLLRTAFNETTQIKANDIINSGFSGINISQELYSRRLHVLKHWKNKFLTHKQ